MPRDFINLSQRQKRRIVSKNSDLATLNRKKISISHSSQSYSSSVASSLVSIPSGSNNNSASEIPELSPALNEPQQGQVQSVDANNLSPDWSIHDVGFSSDSGSTSEPTDLFNFHNIDLMQGVEGQTFVQNSTFSDDLRQCFLNHSVSHSFINDLLHIFDTHRIHRE